MAILSKDRKIRIFNVLSGKIEKTIDESLDIYSTIQQNTPQLANMEFGKNSISNLFKVNLFIKNIITKYFILIIFR
jgi:hypothetical protein